VYSRVSSGSQNLRRQIDAANNALEARNIDKDEVLYLEDFNVSATKNDKNNRPNYKKLLNLVVEDRVAVVFVNNRDRVCRNFYEGSEFNKLMNKHNVEVVYTASDAIPFNKNSSIESFYSIFSQQEGNNIKRRSDDGRKRYPGSLIGYKRIEEEVKNEENKGTENNEKHMVTFIKDNDRSTIIKQLFEEFSKLETKEEFVDVLTKYGKHLNNHSTVMKILQRPFYAAYCHTDYGYDQLSHVQPIIEFDLFEKVQSVLNKFILEYENAVVRAKEKMYIVPRCGVCCNAMKFRNPLGKAAYFVCSSGHKSLRVDLDDLNRIMKDTIITEIQQFTLKKYKAMFMLHYNGVLDNLNHRKKHKEMNLKKKTLSIASESLMKKAAPFNELALQVKETQDEISSIEKEIVSLQSLKSEIGTISKLVNPACTELPESDLISLIELLVKDISIHSEYVEINLYSLKA